MPADIIAFSHLRWNYAYQRPQHILQRMAKTRRVFYIEEPVFTQTYKVHFELIRPAPGVTVCRPQIPGRVPGFAGRNIPPLQNLLGELIEAESIESWVAWFYSPEALPMLGHRSPASIVYDCMEERSAEMVRMEEELLGRADLVLTGGRSLFEARKGRHPNLHYVPSSVDQEHFAPRSSRVDPPLLATIPHPRLGFLGVLDDRLDVDLLAAVADARPDWQFVMVGPILRNDPEALPHRPNIHYLGWQPYRSLPDYIAGWDVCLLPFVRNEATRLICPTTTLEYMAGERPIVSTPIHDEVSEYSHVIGIADDAEAFTNLCQEALSRSEVESLLEVRRMRSIVSQTSWDQTVAIIEGLLGEVEAGMGLNGRAGTMPRATYRRSDSQRWISPSVTSWLPPSMRGQEN